MPCCSARSRWLRSSPPCSSCASGAAAAIASSLFLAASFAIEGVNRAAFALAHERVENEPVYYLVRLCAYALIIVAIIDKNRARR